jgi:hypothetical protein
LRKRAVFGKNVRSASLNEPNRNFGATRRASKRKLFFVFGGFFFVNVGDRRGGFFGRFFALSRTGERVFDESVFKARVDRLDEETNDVPVELELTIQLDEFVGLHAEIGEPIGSAAMVFDRVSEFAFFPKTADANDAAQGLDRFRDLAGNFFRITGVASEFKMNKPS